MKQVELQPQNATTAIAAERCRSTKPSVVISVDSHSLLLCFASSDVALVSKSREEGGRRKPAESSLPWFEMVKPLVPLCTYTAKRNFDVQQPLQVRCKWASDPSPLNAVPNKIRSVSCRVALDRRPLPVDGAPATGQEPTGGSPGKRQPQKLLFPASSARTASRRPANVSGMRRAHSTCSVLGIAWHESESTRVCRSMPSGSDHYQRTQLRVKGSTLPRKRVEDG